MCGALGTPTGFRLTPGQAHDLHGADAFLPEMKAPTLIADKAYDADDRVIEPLRKARKTIVIPQNRTGQINGITMRSSTKAAI